MVRGEAIARTTFQEEDQVIQMAVGLGEDCFPSVNGSDEDPEEEVSFKNSQSSFMDAEGDHDGTESESSYYSEGECSTCYNEEVDQSEDGLPLDQDPEPEPSTSQKIRSIDQEMHTKLRELHELMMAGGLQESANMLETSFGVRSDKAVKQVT